MTPPRTILVASPIEPSGASWLLNCFLELGIMVGHKPVVDKVWRGSVPPLDSRHIWTARNDRSFALNPKARILMKFLPALARQECFRFREDVSVEYVQDFRPRGFAGAHVILVARDPRDSIYSMFRRQAPDLSFGEFVGFPNPQTLLDRPTHWALFMSSWLHGPDVHVVRFEDYKRDAEATLRAALDSVGLRFSDHDIAAALHRSSFESAREAEQLFRERFPDDRQIANRSGSVGEGRNHPDAQPLIRDIERAANRELSRLGYELQEPEGPGPALAARLSARLLAFFDTIQLPPDALPDPLTIPASQPILFALLAFAHRLDDGLVRRAALPPVDTRALHDSLAELATKHADWLAGHLAAARSRYADGSAYFFHHLKATRQVRLVRGHGTRHGASGLPHSAGG